ncbi:uncharacterized protein RHOBADRAFT_46153 [Rhodotorula graminis WP1]|uniref:Methyltransferase type 11 domain-containing protein n=1 Tax=Rhodotorula graminis (strain WP1) TaxID=578459 RepID=A0A0P9H013_RHOGW|nr:uncharacterized protein RHOBADRAFT_46153 [Rhodotorula graminis WP1]KPV73059.1 hypothetical protein RHOBADRAFT_46153 [Rhodotorula graminis WP1]
MLVGLCCFLAGLAVPTLLPALWARLTARSSDADLYDDGADALVLNLDEPSTRWFNMGYWPPGERSFSSAAAELCRQVARAARLEPGQRICEVGYGSGDSTLLLEREFAPAAYLGLTSLASQHATAGEIQLRQGDAAKDLDAEPAGSYDAVLAVDCAYHFNTRLSFLSSASRLLAPGGHLALTDLVLPSTPLSLLDHLLLSLLLLVAGCPRSNLVPLDTYRAQLVAAGFDPDSVETRDVSDEVWGGFCGFVRRREEGMGRGRGVLGGKWDGLRRYARVVEWYAGVRSGRPKMRYCLVSARKA